MVANGKSPWLGDDETTLGRLCCIRLARMLQGTLSIGVSALANGVPEPESFFREQFRILDAHAVVLGTLGGKIQETERTLQLRQYAGELRQGLQSLHDEIEAIRSTGLDPAQVASLNRLAGLARAVCDRVEAYASHLGIELPLIDDVKRVIEEIITSMPSLLEPAADRS